MKAIEQYAWAVISPQGVIQYCSINSDPENAGNDFVNEMADVEGKFTPWDMWLNDGFSIEAVKITARD